MSDSTWDAPNLTTFFQLQDMGLVVTGQRLQSRKAILDCNVVGEDRICPRCGTRGNKYDRVTRRLIHYPVGFRSTMLLIHLNRYHCPGCDHIWRHDTSKAAPAGAKLSYPAMVWMLANVVLNHMTISAVAKTMGISWNTANTAIMEEGRRILLNDPTRFDGVRVIGVDEHVWRRRFDKKTGLGKYVTVIIDLTPVRDKTGSSRLLDIVPGRSKDTFQQWLAGRPDEWKNGIEIVAMDGFTGFKNAAKEMLPHATVVMDPFHVVGLAWKVVDEVRRRLQQEIHGRRGRAGDELYSRRKMLQIGDEYLTKEQRVKLNITLSKPEHAQLATAHAIYQQLRAAYQAPHRREGKRLLIKLVEFLSPANANYKDLPKEARRLGRTLASRLEDILAYFNHPHTSNGPTEAMNGRIENLRRSALGFRNLDNYIARALFEVGGFRETMQQLLQAA